MDVDSRSRLYEANARYWGEKRSRYLVDRVYCFAFARSFGKAVRKQSANGQEGGCPRIRFSEDVREALPGNLLEH